MSEILGTLFKYLVAILGVSAVTLILYQVFGQNKTQNAMSDITLLQTNAQVLYNAQTTFTSLTNAVAIAGKLAPSNMVSGANLANPWGGNVTIAVNGTNAAQFDITEPSVPAESCAKIIVGLTNAVALKVNGAAVALPADAGAATTACNSPLNNTLILTFAH